MESSQELFRAAIDRLCGIRNRPSNPAVAAAVSFAALATVQFGALEIVRGQPSETDAGQMSTRDQGTSSETGADTGVSSDAADSGTDAATSNPTADKLLREAGSIVEQVARIRGLQNLEPIQKGAKRREELRELLVEQLDREQSRREIRNEADVLKKLGMLHRDFDYRETLLEVLTEQIAGFYDQKTDQLNVVVGVPLKLQRPAMAHEIFHAIQDQHFDLTRLMEPFTNREHGDFHLARSALVEGDATVLMIDYSLYREGTLPRGDVRSIVDIPMMANMLEQLDYGELGALEELEAGSPGGPGGRRGGAPRSDSSTAPPGMAGSALAEAPAIIRRTLIFPYLSGMKFVIAMRSGRSWREFDRIYERPPVSTEQILHPDRYARGDEPVILNYDPGPVLRDYRRIYDTVLGEFQMRLFLDRHARRGGGADAERAVDPVEAAAGWDGDRLLAFRNDRDRIVITHLSVWDSTREAAEYYNALVEVNDRRFPDSTTHTASGDHGAYTCLRSENPPRRERVYVERWGDAVLHIEGSPTRLEAGRERDPTTHMLRESIWENLRRRPFRQVYRERMADRDEASRD